jgi:hypothetical protein
VPEAPRLLLVVRKAVSLLVNFQIPILYLLVVEKPVRRREQRQGVVKVNAGARLVMERASFSLGRQTPAHRSTLIPSTPLRGAPRAAALLVLYSLG